MMITQAFSIFLEERTVPVPNVFDDMIRQKIYLYPLWQLADHVFGPEKKEFSKKMEIITVPEPKMPVASKKIPHISFSFSEPHEYKTFPSLNPKVLASVQVPSFTSLTSKTQRFEGLPKPPELEVP
jgi:hypothetical protein